MSSNLDRREKLLAWRRNIFEQVAHIEEDLLVLAENVDPEIESEGQEENLNRLLDRLDDRGKTEIEAIDRALRRIADGSYGTCADCGAAIPAARLDAMLTADTCVRCATQREKKRPAAG